MPTPTKKRVTTCRWCDVGIREETVLVGPPPGREATMYLGVKAEAPGTDGQLVIQRDDGRFRLLAPHTRGRQIVDAYRIHSRRNCAPPDEQRAKTRR